MIVLDNNMIVKNINNINNISKYVSRYTNKSNLKKIKYC